MRSVMKILHHSEDYLLARSACLRKNFDGTFSVLNDKCDWAGGQLSWPPRLYHDPYTLDADDIYAIWRMTIHMLIKPISAILFLFFTACPAIAQTWKIGGMRVSIEGHVSSLCNPRTGDMHRCSLKGNISREARKPELFVLPWETVKVNNVIVVSDDSVVFFGATTLGFEQLSIYSISKKAFIFRQLAAKTSLSPRHDLIAYQSYHPPHGGEDPIVEVGVVFSSHVVQGGNWDSRIIFRDNPQDGKGSEERGSFLCSSELAWSLDETWVGFCVGTLEANSERLILVSPNLNDPTISQKTLHVGDLCRATGQDPTYTCKIFVDQMAISENKITVTIRSMGSQGYRSIPLDLSIN